jgi:UDP-GlcNAc:undecaprenyl-phosphate/decaprenyl-phosphate GlcNAc-1-phosphate transferase
MTVTMLLLAFLLSSKLVDRLRDIPNARSLHVNPVPRIGGIGLWIGVLLGWALEPFELEWWLVLPLLLLFSVSLLDDIRGSSVQLRLSAQLAAAALLVIGSGFYLQHGFLISFLALISTMWLTNLYNFMDGSDGLAGGMAIIGFGTYGIAAMTAQNEAFGLLNLTICASATGFLYFNFPRARLFMGDAGSIPLGFMAAAMGLWGWQHGCWDAWFPLLVFSPFIVDASVTLFKRTLRGEKITEAHRDHFYQRAIRMGWSHRKVALSEYSLMLGCGISALAVSGTGSVLPALLAWVCIYAALMYPLDAAWKRHERSRNV